MRAECGNDVEVKERVLEKMKLASHKWDHREQIGNKYKERNERLAKSSHRPVMKSVAVNPMQARTQALKMQQRMASLPPLKRGRYQQTLDENKRFLEGNPYTFTTTNKHFHIEQ